MGPIAGFAAGVAALVAVATGTLASAADVDITGDSTTGFLLDGSAGTTATVESGVAISNTFTFYCPNVSPPGLSAAALCASTKAWTVTNNGTIGPADFGDGVHFSAGGDVVNLGEIGGGGTAIWVEGGVGTVDNRAGATIAGSGLFSTGVSLGTPSDPSGGTVINAGTITGAIQGITISGNGTVINKAGALIEAHGEVNGVSFILGTNHTLINSGTIKDNDSGYATGVALDNGTVTNNAGGRILGAYNGIWANGSGATSIVNAGYIEASQAQGFGSAIEFDAGGSLVNSGIVRSSTSNGATDDAGISFRGAGSITNTGTIESTTGGLAIKFNGSADHTLILGTGSVLGGNVAGGSGTDNLVLEGTGSELLSKFINFETLAMNAGDWTVTGAGTFSGGAEIKSGGVLHVNGTLTAPTITVDRGGTVSGTGMIAGVLVVNGAVGPGNSIGILEATTAAFNAGSLLSVEVDPTNADKLIVDGTVTIDPGATVLVAAAAGTYTLGQRYLILDAGSRVGDFGGVSDTSAFLDFTLDQSDPKRVWLQISRVGKFTDVALTPNQRAAATGLQELDPTNPLFQAILPLDAETARLAFDLSSGEVHPTVRGVLVADTRFLRDAILARLSQRFADDFAQSAPPLAYADGAGGPPDLAPRWAGWGLALGSWQDAPGDGNAARFSRALGGFATGLDTGWGMWSGGLAFAYQNASLSVPDRLSTASASSYSFAAYGATAWGPFALRAGGAIAAHDISTVRHDQFPGFSETLTARYGALSEQVFGEVAYPTKLGAVNRGAVPVARRYCHPDRRLHGERRVGGAFRTGGERQPRLPDAWQPLWLHAAVRRRGREDDRPSCLAARAGWRRGKVAVGLRRRDTVHHRQHAAGGRFGAARPRRRVGGHEADDPEPCLYRRDRLRRQRPGRQGRSEGALLIRREILPPPM